MTVTASSTSAVYADVNAANAAITFVAPASGTVIIEANFAAQTQGPGDQVGANLRDGGGDIANTKAFIFYLNANFGLFRSTCMWKITGLVPGNSYTYKLGFARIVGVAAVLIAAGQSPMYGPLTMKAWAA